MSVGRVSRKGNQRPGAPARLRIAASARFHDPGRSTLHIKPQACSDRIRSETKNPPLPAGFVMVLTGHLSNPPEALANVLAIVARPAPRTQGSTTGSLRLRGT